MAHLKKRIRPLCLASFFCLLAVRPSAAQTAPPLQIVNFTGELALQAGNQIVVLKAGMAGYSIPQNQEITILSGEALLLADKTFVSAAQGASFTYVAVGGRPRLWVHAGTVMATTAGQTRTYAKGEVAMISETPVEQPPAPPPQATPAQPEEVPPPAPAPVAAPVPAPAPPAQPEQAPPAPVAVPEQAPPEAPAPAEGFAPFHVSIELHPHYILRETYDDNIFLVPRDLPGPDVVGGGVRGAWITSNNLGLTYTAPLNRSQKIQGNVDLNAQNYSKFSKANDAYDTTEQVTYSYAGKMMAAKLSNSFQNTEIPAFSELVARQRHWQDTTALKLDVTETRQFIYAVDAAHTVVKYLDPTISGLLNHYEQLFGGKAGVKIAPKTDVYLAYHRGIAHYSAGRNANSKGHSLDAGIEGDIATRLKGVIQAGWQYRNYDTAPGLPNAARTWQTSVGLKYAGRNLRGDLNAFRNFSESTFGVNRYYIATGADLSGAWTLQKLTLGLAGSVETDKYPEAAAAGGLTAVRRDDLYSWTVSGEYRLIEWLTAKLSFNRLSRFSIFSRQFNYADGRTSAEIKASF